MKERGPSGPNVATARALASLRPLLASLRRTAPVTAEQLQRATTEVARQILSAERAPPSVQRTHWRGALVSLGEAMTLLRLLVEARLCTWQSARVGYGELAHAHRLLVRLASPKRRGERRRAA